MTTIHAELVGAKAVLPRLELENLLEIARRNEPIEYILQQEEIPVAGLMRLAEQSGAFDFLNAEEDLYSIDDLKVRYR